MQLSKYTILSRIRDSRNWFILNLLSGEADILEPELAEQVLHNTLKDKKPFIEKGYLMEPVAEKKLFKSRYLDFKDQQDNAEVQVFYIPGYQCNFACTYCYQESYSNPEPHDQKGIIDSFFKHLEKHMAGRSYYITLFGGEPLLPDQQSRNNINYLLDEADNRGISLAVVTNGYTLESYLPRLQKSDIREIQITLDGMAPVHDVRRPLKGGQPTFKTISSNVTKCLAAGIPVNLRVVLDKHNIDNLPALSAYARGEGWLDSPLFKTQLGRNYELHSCQIDHERLFSRVEMYERLYRLIQDHPEVAEFHRPAFSLSRFLMDNGELPEPLFDSCPAAKTEWAFDYTGRIYPCTAMAGKDSEELGSFYPESNLLEDRCETWQDRDVLAIDECRNCPLQLACGGGCGAVAKNRTGNVISPDCRPVKELMEMGISLYFEKGDMK